MSQLIIKKPSKKIKLIFQEKSIIVNGPLGSLTLENFDYTSSTLHKENFFFLNQKKLNNFVSSIKILFNSVSFGWFKELNLKGIGYKCFKIEDKIALDIGQSNIILFHTKDIIKVKVFKNRLILFSLDKVSLNNFIYALKQITPVDRYKGKGILIKDEIIKLKKKKSS